ncbi:MAG TPA: FAD-binding oxidoreductase [Gemmataceae bacterium]|nr:FAD-binding oxidoreductase [Gemmataceae bacterium]
MPVVEHHPETALTSRRPASVAEAGQEVRQAIAAGHAIYPVGGQTQWDLGLPPSKPGILLDTRRLDGIIDYPASDMTITVRAGMTVAQLQTTLAREKQRLPIDVPHADRATVGGIIATNTSGARRHAWGTLRDYVIGISVVNDEGHEIKAGGRVVKNVAGYDLCKLFVGSMGTLGIITQVTFKLRPLPAEQALFAFPCSPTEIDNALTLLHDSKTRPVMIELLSPSAAQMLAGKFQDRWPADWSVVVGFEDNADALRWQVRTLIQELGGRFSVSGVLGSCADPVWQALAEFPANCDSPLSFKAGVPASAVTMFCPEVAEILHPVQLQVHARNGIVVGHCQSEDSADRLRKVRELAMSLGGHVVVTRCPLQWKTTEFIWGPPSGDAWLMRAIKDKLDPRGLFNPGRHFV